MSLSEENRNCLLCKKGLRGRVDKKFCDDTCRAVYNNQHKIKNNNSVFIRKINSTLLKNRRILQEALPPANEMIKVQHDNLLQKGFAFKFHTHLYTNKKGNIYYFCYDYGYLPLENRWYLIVKGKE